MSIQSSYTPPARWQSAARRWPLAVLAAALLATTGLACGGDGKAKGTTVPKPVKPIDKPVAPPAPEAPLVSAQGEGESEDAAYANAVTELENKLYGSAEWAAVLDVPVHDRNRDSTEMSQDAGMARASVGVSRDRVTEILAAVEQAPWRPEVPQPLAEATGNAAQAHLSALLCQRRQALLQTECDPTSVEEANAQLQDLASALRLRSYYAGGVPVDNKNRPLRPLTIVVELQVGGIWQPVSGVPVAVVVEDADDASGIVESAEGSSDENGKVTFAIVQGATWPSRLQVGLVRAALLGPLAELWPALELPVPGREIEIGRWALVATERVQGESTGNRVFANKLARLMGRGTRLPMELESQLAKDRREALAGKLPALADSWEGKVDVLLVAKVDSDYAGRLSARQRWYEASGSIQVYNAWTGKLVKTLDDTVKASGVGEQRADQAARQKLAENLGEDLIDLSL